MNSIKNINKELRLKSFFSSLIIFILDMTFRTVRIINLWNRGNYKAKTTIAIYFKLALFSRNHLLTWYFIFYFHKINFLPYIARLSGQKLLIFQSWISFSQNKTALFLGLLCFSVNITNVKNACCGNFRRIFIWKLFETLEGKKSFYFYTTR